MLSFVRGVNTFIIHERMVAVYGMVVMYVSNALVGKSGITRIAASLLFVCLFLAFTMVRLSSTVCHPSNGLKTSRAVLEDALFNKDFVESMGREDLPLPLGNILLIILCYRWSRGDPCLSSGILPSFTSSVTAAVLFSLHRLIELL